MSIVPEPTLTSMSTPAAPTPASSHWKPCDEDAAVFSADGGAAFWIVCELTAGAVAGGSRLSLAYAAEGALAARTAMAAGAVRLVSFSMMFSVGVVVGLRVEVRVEHSHLGDLVDRQLVARRGLADGFWGRCVVNAERGALVRTHIGVHPGDGLLGVALDDRPANVRSAVGHRDLESIGEGALHHVSRHVRPPDRLVFACREPTDARRRAHREDSPCCDRSVPMLGRRGSGRPDLTSCLNVAASLAERWGALPMRAPGVGHRLANMRDPLPRATVATAANRRDHLAVDTATRPGPADATGLLERASALSRLHEGTKATVELRRGHVVLISGEAGIGKTALLRQFRASLPRRVSVSGGACEPMFT